MANPFCTGTGKSFIIQAFTMILLKISYVIKMSLLCLRHKENMEITKLKIMEVKASSKSGMIGLFSADQSRKQSKAINIRNQK